MRALGLVFSKRLNAKEFCFDGFSSVNEVICHGIPDKRPLEDGDIVNGESCRFVDVEHSREVETSKQSIFVFFSAVDITVCHRGFHGDLNETFFVGNVDEESKKLVRVTYECLDQAIEQGKHIANDSSVDTQQQPGKSWDFFVDGQKERSGWSCSEVLLRNSRLCLKTFEDTLLPKN